jgi:protein-tyrosine phosphatase
MHEEGGATPLSHADEPAATGTPPARSGPALFVDDGPVRFPAGLSVVDVDGSRWHLLRVGALTETMVTRMAGEVVLFVCTGNTCRSPMAEAVCRRLLSDRLGCRDEELSDRGFVVLSAGIAAGYGAPASPEAVELLRDRGCDLQNHASRPLTERLLEGADRIYAMTDQHRRAILAARPELAERVRLLSPAGRDVPDPIGGGLRDYEECLRTIESHVQAVLDELAPGPRD